MNTQRCNYSELRYVLELIGAINRVYEMRERNKAPTIQ